MSAEFEERVLTVPLRDVQKTSITNRADTAMTIIRSHLAQHFKVEEDDIRLDPSINEVVWERGRGTPPRKIRIRAARFDEEGEQVVEAEAA